MAISVAEHEKLLEAFRSNDGDMAESLVKKTAAIGGRVLLESMTEAEGGQGKESILKQRIDV